MFKWLRKRKEIKKPEDHTNLTDPVRLVPYIAPVERLKRTTVCIEAPEQNGHWMETYVTTLLCGRIVTERVFVSHLVWCPDDCKQFHPTFKPRTKEEYQADKILDTTEDIHAQVTEAISPMWAGWEGAPLVGGGELGDLQPHEEKQ